ncbi:MAG TPA: MFS transporter [Jatrophihabitantaceae bacterium]|jgi:MFS family permease
MRALADRQARLYLGGQLFSLFGDTVLLLAMAIWVKELTGSTGAAGLTFLFLTAPTLLAPAAGLLVDRVRRRPLLLAVNVIMSLAVLPLLAVHGAGQVWLIYAVMAIYGAAFLVLSSGESALLAVMLPDELLGEANSALALIRSLTRLVAPLVGAALFVTVGPRAVVLIDSATFVIAAAAMAMLTVREARSHRVPERWRQQLLGGIRHLRQVAELRLVVVACAIGWSVLGLAETVVFAVVAGLHRPPAFIGVLVCVQGAGAVIGAVSAPQMMRRYAEGPLVAISLIAGGAAWAAQTLAVLWLTVSALFVVGLTLSWLSVGTNTLIQRRTPTELLGRVDSVASISVSAPQTVFIALGAAMVAVIDYRWLLTAMTVAMTISGGWLLSRTEQGLRVA